MADTVHSTLYDGARNINLKYTIYSDGTGQSGTVILNASTLVPNPGTHMKIRRIRYNIDGMYVRLQWDASSPVDIALLGNGQDILDFHDQYAGGFPNDAGAGVTGNVLLTTIGQVNGSNATINIEAIKGV
jgi:hypothetical protein